MLQDSTGKWVAWVNEVGKELRNLETSEECKCLGEAVLPFKAHKMRFQSCGMPSRKPLFRLNTVATRYLSRAAYLLR